jgi:hypothetical protein
MDSARAAFNERLTWAARMGETIRVAVAGRNKIKQSRLGLLCIPWLALGCVAPPSRAAPIRSTRIATADAAAADVVGREAGSGAAQLAAEIPPVRRPATASFATAVRITSPCLLHAGEVDVHRREQRGPGGQVVRVTESSSCSMDAECVEEQGKRTQGDGFVALVCKARSCKCSIERAGPPAKKRSLRFSIDDSCTSVEKAKALIVERCMVGMQLVAD